MAELGGRIQPSDDDSSAKTLLGLKGDSCISPVRLCDNSERILLAAPRNTSPDGDWLRCPKPVNRRGSQTAGGRVDGAACHRFLISSSALNSKQRVRNGSVSDSVEVVLRKIESQSF